MPSWYVHIQTAAETLERLNTSVPPGSPLTAAEAMALHDAGHDNRNYLAAGALGPDLFFLLPDFKGDLGAGLLGLVRFALGTWAVIDEEFLKHWEKWMAPTLDDANTLANGISGGMLGEVAQVQNLVNGALMNLGEGLVTQMLDVFGFMTSGTQAGFADSAFFWSDMFHYRKTYAFARQLYRNAMAADTMKTDPLEPSRVPKQRAFALGWISHCATDVAGHPFTNAKTGGPYRTHWQRHHVVENHMDARAYTLRHPDPLLPYSSLDTSALHFRLAFQKGTVMGNDPAMPDDVPSNRDYFPASFTNPAYPLGDTAHDADVRKQIFNVETEPLPVHICELILQTMKDVYTGPLDNGGPQVLAWDAGMHTGTGGRPTVQMLQDMFKIAYTYVKMSTSSGLAPRMPRTGQVDVITDHPLPRPPGFIPDDSAGANPNESRELNFLDILLALFAWPLWLLEMTIWVATILPALINDLATWPLRELLHELLVLPAWSFYMLSRNLLVMEGFLLPKPEEISPGLVTLGVGAIDPIAQLRADLLVPSGFAPLLGFTEPSGLMADRGASMQGFSADSAYPRNQLWDSFPPFLSWAPMDGDVAASDYVAPWRYPDHNLAGHRNGWEAPRTHVGPYMQGDNATILMGLLPGSNAARASYEAAHSPAETEAVSAALIPTAGQHLGDPIDYGAYLMGKLSGNWLPVSSGTPATYVGHDDNNPLPDFNLDADRGYGHLCWDYVRHGSSVPGSPNVPADMFEPDQWRCAPSEFFGAFTDATRMTVRNMYGYAEPCTVPQRYKAGDNIHHRTRYDPLKKLYVQYLPPAGPPPGEEPLMGCDVDLQVSEKEMMDVMLSPTGRPVP